MCAASLGGRDHNLPTLVIPHMRYNVFMQVKRPAEGARARGREGGDGLESA